MSFLDDTEQLFLQLVESSPDGIVIVDENGAIQRVNKQIRTLFKYDNKELIGQKIEMLIPDRFKDIHPNHRTKFFENSKLRTMGADLDLFGKRKDGTEFNAEIMLNPFTTLEDEKMTIAAIRNVTDKIKEQKLF